MVLSVGNRQEVDFTPTRNNPALLELRLTILNRGSVIELKEKIAR